MVETGVFSQYIYITAGPTGNAHITTTGTACVDGYGFVDVISCGLVEGGGRRGRRRKDVQKIFNIRVEAVEHNLDAYREEGEERGMYVQCVGGCNTDMCACVCVCSNF